VGTHGHLPENENYGGVDQGGPDPRLLPDGQTFDRRVGIAGFEYLPGNQGLAAPIGSPPVVRAGEPLRFDNLDWGAQIFHHHGLQGPVQPLDRHQLPARRRRDRLRLR
jgi:hypothetical protein